MVLSVAVTLSCLLVSDVDHRICILIVFNRYDYFVSIGLGYMFEEPTVSELKVVKYKAIKGPIPEPVVTEEDGTEAE